MIPIKLPKEVLNLFPKWEHRCPSCNTYVEYGKSFCPNCKMSFDEEKWRVPPRFLKGHEAMSEYAHKVLAPKLSPKQRELLFKYFTELFSDGFESGDFSAWTGTYTGSSDSLTVAETNPHHGTYCAECYVDAGGNARFWKTFSEQATIYCRYYLKINEAPSTNQQIFWFNSATGVVFRAFLFATRKIAFGIRDGSGWIGTVSSTTALTLGQWYCVEWKWYYHATNGEGRLYIDGVEEASQVGYDTTYYGQAIKATLGLCYTVTDELTHWIDCAFVADTYIGPETTEQTYTKTWTADVLFKKLGISKILNVDVAFQKQNIPKTFVLDSTFQKSFAIQEQIDVLFKKLDILETFGIDIGFLKRGIIRSFALDLLLKKLDATKTFGVDVYFGPVGTEAYAKTFALDVIFAYKVKFPELWLDENGRIVLNISKPYTWVGS